MTLVGLLNALAVATLYVPQVMAPSSLQSVSERHDWLQIAAVFLGYCMGNVITAFNLVPLISNSTRNHLGLLAAALLMTASAPTMLAFVAGCFLTGVGASVAQRLLGIAAHLAGPDRAGNAVAGCVATALLAVLGLRMWGEQLACTLGWRTVFGLMAVPFIGWFLVSREAASSAASAFIQDPPVNAIRLIRSCIMLRQSMVQQAMVFATYNAAWVLLAAQVPANERIPASFWGSLAGITSLIALSVFLDRGRIRYLHRLGNASMLLAGCPLLLIAYAGMDGQPSLGLLATLSLGMALVDAGMQLTLVANQTRVQAIAPSSKGRLASLLTISGALGGAIAGGASRWLWQCYGWQAALTFIALTAAGGLLVACAPTSARKRISGHRREHRGPFPVSVRPYVQTTSPALGWRADRDARGHFANQGNEQ